MNGARINTPRIRVARDVLGRVTVWFAAGPGITFRATAASHAGHGPVPMTGTPGPVFVWPGKLAGGVFGKVWHEYFKMLKISILKYSCHT